MPDRLLRCPHDPASWFSCPSVIPSIGVWAGPVTCFLPTAYGKGDVMSLQRLHYVKFHHTNRLVLELCFLSPFLASKMQTALCEKPDRENMCGKELRGASRSCFQLNDSQQYDGLSQSFILNEMKFVNNPSNLGN